MLYETVRDGRVGDIIGVFVNRMNAGVGFDGCPGASGWRTDPNLMCGMSIESLSHDIDMLLHLVDGVTSVSANTFFTIPELPKFDNNASVSFRLKNGGTGTINSSFCSYVGYSCRGVIGTKGTAMITGDGYLNFVDFIIKTKEMPYEMVTRVNDRFEKVDGIFEAPSVFATVNRLFKESVEKDVTPPSTGEDGLRALIFSHAILESNRTGKAVPVDL